MKDTYRITCFDLDLTHSTSLWFQVSAYRQKPPTETLPAEFVTEQSIRWDAQKVRHCGCWWLCCKQKLATPLLPTAITYPAAVAKSDLSLYSDAQFHSSNGNQPIFNSCKGCKQRDISSLQRLYNRQKSNLEVISSKVWNLLTVCHC